MEIGFASVADDDDDDDDDDVSWILNHEYCDVLTTYPRHLCSPRMIQICSHSLSLSLCVSVFLCVRAYDAASTRVVRKRAILWWGRHSFLITGVTRASLKVSWGNRHHGNGHAD